MLLELWKFANNGASSIHGDEKHKQVFADVEVGWLLLLTALVAATSFVRNKLLDQSLIVNWTWWLSLTIALDPVKPLGDPKIVEGVVPVEVLPVILYFVHHLLLPVKSLL